MKLAFHEVRFCSWRLLVFRGSVGQKMRKTCFFAVRARFGQLLSRVFACFLHFQRVKKYAKRAFLQCARAFGSFFHVFLHAFCIFHNPKQAKFAYPTVRARPWEAKFAYPPVRARPWEAKFAYLTVRALPRIHQA